MHENRRDSLLATFTSASPTQKTGLQLDLSRLQGRSENNMVARVEGGFVEGNRVREANLPT